MSVINAGETNANNNFVDELGRISGNVRVDDDNNDSGDTNLANVTVELLDNNGDVVTSKTTDNDGNYEFSDLLAGDYQVRQVNLAGYGDVTDTVLDVTLGAGESRTSVNFVDELGHISGNVKSDDDDNDTGDTNLANVRVELLDSDGDIISNTTTNSQGNYEFDRVLPGDYKVRQVNLTGYGDVTDTVIDVAIAAGETSTSNNFIDELGRISGNVKSDDDDNDTGDTNLDNVTVELLDSNGDVVSSTRTNPQGNYEFDRVLPGDYQVRQVNLAGYGDVTDTVLDVAIAAGETSTDNNFVDELSRLGGNVQIDEDNDGTGDSNLANVKVELLDRNGNVVTDTTTDNNGRYEFSGITPGDYQVRQVNLTGYGDVTDTVVDITIAAGETSSDVNFVDKLGRISGNVTSDDDDNGTGDTNLSGVTVELLDANGDLVSTTATNDDGNYEFSGLLPGNYQVEQTNLTGYGDVTPNVLDVNLDTGESDKDNNFIDELGSISGNVKSDDDNDDLGDTNLADVTVELLDNNGNAIATTTTNSRGNYKFNGITPGDYTVRQVNLDGYGDVTPTVLDVAIAAGETITRNNFVDELAQISGNVMVDDNDDGTGDTNLENVTVELLDSNGDVVATTSTNTQGNYEFSGITPGDYQVRQVNLTGYGDVTDTVLDVTIGAGETNSGVNFIDELGRISGNVKSDDDDNDTGDTNLENVTVELLNTNGDVIATASTNAGGNYQFSDLLPGNYQVRQVNLTGYGDVTDTVLDIAIEAGETNSNVNFVDELGRIGGSVTADNDNNDTGDTPLANVRVELINNNGDIIATATTDDAGSYEFVGVTPGDYQVRQINLTGYGDVTPTAIDVTIDAGETNADVSFVDELGRITGSVTADEDNNDIGDAPLANAIVELIDSNGDVIATATTDDAGIYEFSGITPGDYQVRQVNTPGYGDVTPTVVDVIIGAGEAKETNFVDEEFGKIDGSVSIDNDNNDSPDAPLANVTLNLLDPSGTLVATTTSDDEGNYQFSDVTPGEYTVEQVNLTGYGDVSDRDGEDPNHTNLSLSAGMTQSVNFVDELGRISGNVKADDDNDDLGDSNLADVTVDLLDANNDVVLTTTTDDEGNYEFANLLAGDYSVRQTNLTGYGDVNEVDSNQTAPLDTEAEARDANNDNILAVSLAPGEADDGNDFIDEQLGSLSGNVAQDTTGDGLGDTPLANVFLAVLDDTGASVATTTTDAEGNYEFDNLAPGVYTITETSPDGLVTVAENEGGADDDRNDDGILSSIEAVVGAGENDIENNFVEATPAEINGRVWGDRNADNTEGDFEPGIAGVTVELLQDGEVIGSTISNSDGVYQFANITPGDSYQVFFDSTSFPPSYQGGLSTPNLGDSTTDSDADVDTGKTTFLNLGPNALVNDLDLGLLEPELNEVEGTAVPELLVGTAISDVISGYKGQDTLTGGGGDDRFVYTETSDGVDIITDFATGEDQIDLSQIMSEELGYTGTDAIGDGLVVIESYDSIGTMIQVDFDSEGELFAKDVVFLDGVDNLNPDTDLIF